MIFVAFFEAIGVIILFCLLVGIFRGLQSASAWHRTTATIQTFGMTDGTPKTTYEYRVDGVTFCSSAIIPGAFYFGKKGDVKAPKASCLNPDGSLKFAPGAVVDVFYNPRNPADAALVPGLQAGEAVKMAAFGLVLILVPLIGWQNQNWASDNTHALIAGFFFLGGFVGLVLALVFFRRCLQTRNYPFVMGRLLSATAAYCPDTDTGGYTPIVDYEYCVNGMRYQSQQLSAIPTRVVSSQTIAQAKVDRLLANPEIKVYYAPEAPWESFLFPGPYWGIAIPLAICAGFSAFGFFFLNH